MALIKCPECGKEISDKAEACPNCAYPIAQLSGNHKTSEETEKTQGIVVKKPIDASTHVERPEMTEEELRAREERRRKKREAALIKKRKARRRKIIIISCIAIALIVCAVSFFMRFGPISHKNETVLKAEELISAIGEVSIDNEAAVIAAQSYYDSLSEDEKTKVENYGILEDAQNELTYQKCISYEEEGSLLLAFEGYKSLPEDYKDVARKIELIEPYVSLNGTFSLADYTGSYAPEFHSVGIKIYPKTSEDGTFHCSAEITQYNKNGGVEDVVNLPIKNKNEALIMEHPTYAATVFGKADTGTLVRRYQLTGDTLTYTYIFDETEILGVYDYVRADEVDEN